MNGGDINLTRGMRVRITAKLVQTLTQALQRNEDHVIFDSGETSETGDVTLNFSRGGRILSELSGDEEAIRPS